MPEPSIHIRVDGKKNVHYFINCAVPACPFGATGATEASVRQQLSEHQREAHPPKERNTKTKELRRS
jgi:predicted small metal-binding protein